MPYGGRDLGQHWFRQWLVAWRHQAITWINVDLSSLRSCDVHLRTISLEISQPSVPKISLKIIFPGFYLNLPGANELTLPVWGLTGFLFMAEQGLSQWDMTLHMLCLLSMAKTWPWFRGQCIAWSIWQNPEDWRRGLCICICEVMDKSPLVYHDYGVFHQWYLGFLTLWFHQISTPGTRRNNHIIMMSKQRCDIVLTS